MDSEVGNTTTMSVDYEDYDFVNDDGVSYNVSPDVPHFVYIMSCFFMALICVFGVISNASIFVLFINSPLVSHSVWKSQKKVSFNYASEASYVYIWSGQKLKWSILASFWKPEACG